MAQQRRVQLSTQRPTSTVCVLGTELALDVCGCAPRGCSSFQAQGTPGVKLWVVHEARSVKLPSSVSCWPLATRPELLLAMDAPSADVGDEKVRISYFREAGGVPVARAVLYVTCVEVSLEADVNRSGAVSRTLLDKTSWTWGPDGHGAVLLVNCDRDDPGAGSPDCRDTTVRSYEDLQDMSQLLLRTRGPGAIFARHTLLLHLDCGDAHRLGVFYGGNAVAPEQFQHVLGGPRLSFALRPRQRHPESLFYIEALAFPDRAFPGLVSIHATLLDSPEQGSLEAPLFTDSVMFRVAPWIMTPNTASPLEVFVCSVEGNDAFVGSVAALAERAQCPLTVCPPPQNRQDRWIQDEMEFGYVQAPHKTFPVVFDSPRDRGLKDFPVKSILVPPLPRKPQKPCPETPKNPFSPRVSGMGKPGLGNPKTSGEIPLIVAFFQPFPPIFNPFSPIFPAISPLGGRRMAQAVRDFLGAQQVQAPVELFSAWLQVGHVDEFLTFVPAPDRKGFRLLLASPSACFQLLRDKQEEGFGEATMFQG
ncbi:PADI3 deiminase, partial [Origma solitaria]|nr:PADI3 deiminase [Origma solitaria]